MGEALRLEYIDVDQLADNPANWRRHGESQIAALKGVLGEVGWAGACLYNERTERLIDGHARKKVSTGKVPVLIGSWSEEDELKILATLDPLAAMAEANKDALGRLLHECETENPALQEMLDGLAAENGIDTKDNETELRQLNVLPPPAMTWVLVGLPTVRFGEIAETVERLSTIDGITLETTSNNGPKD